MTKIIFRLKGGPGSGFRDHEGIPGHQGGSLPQGEPAGRMTGVRLPSLEEGKPDEIRPITKPAEAVKLKPIAGIKSGSDFEDRYHGLFKLESQVETVQGNGERYYNPTASLRKLAGFALDHFDEAKHEIYNNPEQSKELLIRMANWDPSQDKITMASDTASSLAGALYRIISKVYDKKDISTLSGPRWYL